MSTKFTGKIHRITIKQGKAPYGFIAPDTPIPGHKGKIRFFGDKLVGTTIDQLEIGNLVEFSLKEWKKRFGSVEKVAEDVKIINYSNLGSSDSLNSNKLFISSKNRDKVSLFSNLNVKDFKLRIITALGLGTGISDPAEFEDYSFMLLRLLGIHNLYQYDKKSQAGKADGFFIVGSLAVMYDCTLRKNFEEHKKEQIENYVNKLKNSQITIDVKITDGRIKKKTLQIQGKNRQVWIITQNQTREFYDVDGIRVKEVSIQDLLKVFNKRLHSDSFEEDELSANLAVIDKT
ncbi:hypothetical protein B6N60_03136 [Richelia sinica FACHB-800]|uniref:Uncharacterized protein n=1 Tax=Richelia sinica FACHB-800 TaxID=1357546 RepID=A0A975TAL7_9NOST|nr:hypothetical protein [Richelia sinica]MBD2663272.1 hypothetical protein [Richelia sinica FACHB-800]QXE24431.1 hypothetical protein B6N60_03136 [Richelia sinica FACHB-800]